MPESSQAMVQHDGLQCKPRTSEMFLKPAQLPKGKAYFADNIVPRKDRRTISDNGNTKFIVSFGPKKPKLEQVTPKSQNLF